MKINTNQACANGLMASPSFLLYLIIFFKLNKKNGCPT